MNASRLTRHIAQGIAIYAAYMDTCDTNQSDQDRLDIQAWEDWSNAYPQYAQFVCKEQYNLFDRVNAKF